jgi:hypothetical protein
MDNVMKIKMFLILVILFYQPMIYATSFDIVNLNNTYIGKEVWNKNNVNIITHGSEYNLNILNKLTVDTLYNDSELLPLMKKIHINTWLYPNSKSTSFSNANNKECIINISYDEKLTPFILNDFKKDVVFVITHELSHCILGKKIFEQKMDWKFLLKESQKENLNAIIIRETKSGIIKINGKEKIIKPIPLIVYHETFADTFATLWLYSKGIYNIADIEEILYKREAEYNANNITAYLGYLTLKDVLQMIQKNHIVLKNKSVGNIYETSILLTQKTFISYLLTNNNIEKELK